MGEEEDRLAVTASVNAGDEVALGGRGVEHLYVLLGEAGIAQAPGYRFGSSGHVSGRRVSRVDLDELFEDIAGKPMVGIGLRDGKRSSEKEAQDSGDHIKMKIINAVTTNDRPAALSF